MKSPTFVLDASVALMWCFETDASGYANAVLDSLASATAAAPAIWPLEIGNALIVLNVGDFPKQPTAPVF
jgi:hypothetical protein